MAILPRLLAGPLRAVVAIVLLAAMFWVLESLWPEDRAQPKWRRDSLTDVAYWFLGYASRICGTIVVLIAIAITARFLPRTGLSQIKVQPLPLQAFELLAIGDLIGYWKHRTFHTVPSLWRIHAVHHSPDRVDWLASARVHPLDTIVDRLVVLVPLDFLGFTAASVAPYAVFLAIYPIYLHANVSWGYGPLHYVLSSPAFHRWHHSSEPAALNKNFSGLFPIVDVLFGTAYFPNRRSGRYGLYREQMPRGIRAQLLYPFRRARSNSTPTTQSSPRA